MPDFQIGERVAGSYNGHYVVGEIVYVRNGVALHIRLDPTCITGIIRGWPAEDNNYDYGPGRYWSVQARDMYHYPPTTTREMSRKLMREMGYA